MNSVLTSDVPLMSVNTDPLSEYRRYCARLNIVLNKVARGDKAENNSRMTEIFRNIRTENDGCLLDPRDVVLEVDSWEELKNIYDAIDSKAGKANIAQKEHIELLVPNDLEGLTVPEQGTELFHDYYREPMSYLLLETADRQLRHVCFNTRSAYHEGKRLHRKPGGSKVVMMKIPERRETAYSFGVPSTHKPVFVVFKPPIITS